MNLKQITIPLCLMAAALASGMAMADEPTVTILSPSGTVYLATYPSTVPLSFRVNHPSGQVKDLNVLGVQVDGSTIVNGGAAIGNPFQGPANTNSCANTLAAAGITSCTIDDATQASVGANWTVSAPGNYVLKVSIKHTSTLGVDEENVTVATLVAEYPAPPSVANAYINANYSIKSRVRGCIISAIAELHAKDSAYGPKGGPYDEAAIRGDVDTFRTLCGG